jgi:hypothetical protein
MHTKRWVIKLAEQVMQGMADLGPTDYLPGLYCDLQFERLARQCPASKRRRASRLVAEWYDRNAESLARQLH